MNYILSQIFIIFNYVFLVFSYIQKNYLKVLLHSCLAMVASGLSFLFLGAYTGATMPIIVILANIIFFMVERMKEGRAKKVFYLSSIILLFLGMSLFTYFTYDTAMSLCPAFGTFLFIVSLWQKNSIVYKLCGILSCVVYVAYNIYFKSLFGSILESMLLIFLLVGMIMDIVKRNKKINAEALLLQRGKLVWKNRLLVS